jgi:TonB-dependent starch-binding outer membrane protein SusC
MGLIWRIYSYRWAGLDPTNGDPRGYVGKDISKEAPFTLLTLYIW